MLCGRFVSVAEADDVLAPLRLHLRRALCCNSKSRLCAEQDTFCTCILSSRVFKLNLWMMCPLLHSFYGMDAFASLFFMTWYCVCPSSLLCFTLPQRPTQPPADAAAGAAELPHVV